MPPFWFHSFSAIWVPLSVLSALLVVIDIFALGRRQKMGIMEAVWPLTMLYWGPLGLIPYGWFGRAAASTGGDDEKHAHHRHHHGGDTPMWQAVFKGATHCGAGCALGDGIGDWGAYLFGWSLFGSDLGARALAAFVLAYLAGILFQYFSVAPMQGLRLGEGLMAAVKIDTLSLLAYQAGMILWMVIGHWLLPGLRPTEWSYWVMMQIAMLLGFATAYPANWWLIAKGVKERM